MTIGTPFFKHETIRNTIVAFGSLFSDLTIERSLPNGKVEQIVNVPLSYAPKEKWLRRLREDPTLNQKTLIDLPRLSFEINGYSYDSSRKINKYYQTINNGVIARTPVPYNITLSLYIYTKTSDDAFVILEQILPEFQPELTMTIVSPNGDNLNVPLILNAVGVEDSYDGSFTERRAIIHTLTFTMKVNLFGALSDGNSGGIIKKVIVKTGDSVDRLDETYTAEVVPQSANKEDPHTIVETWTMNV